MTEREVELLDQAIEAWNGLIGILCERLGKDMDWASAQLDGLDSYYDLDNPDHWSEILNVILSLRGKVGELE